MAIATEAQWLDLVIDCLGQHVEETGRAATGAGLASRVIKKAAAQDLIIPPELSRVKFSVLLGRLEDAGRLVKLLRPGADFFIAPADRPQLLAEWPGTSNQPAPGIRRDLFLALTRVGSQRPWYQPSDDSIIWIEDGAPPPAGSIDLPAPDFTSLEGRAQAFIDSLSGENQEQLREALGNANSLASFSGAVRSLGLQSQWQEFRTRSLTDTLKTWALDKGLAFQSQWLTSASDGRLVEQGQKSASEQDDRAWRSSLGTLLVSLEKEDLQRVSVPLDLVLRILASQRR